MHRQSGARAGNHQRHTRTRNVSLPTQANHTARGARKQPPNQGAIHLHPPPVCAGRGVLPAADGQACSGGYVCACVCDWVRGVDHLSFRPFCLLRSSAPALPCWASSRAPGGCPSASVSVVCALRESLSRPRWVPCPCVCVWCLGGTGYGVM